jgi:hypothetical protein
MRILFGKIKPPLDDDESCYFTVAEKYYGIEKLFSPCY